MISTLLISIILQLYKQSLKKDFSAEGCNFVSFIIQIKMYGINSELARRMERRLREKIYREMIEEQQEYRKRMEEEKIGNRNNYVKTEPDDNDTVYSYKRRNKDYLNNL